MCRGLFYSPKRIRHFRVRHGHTARNCRVDRQVAVGTQCAIGEQLSCQSWFSAGDDPDKAECGFAHRCGPGFDDGGECIVFWSAGVENHQHCSAGRIGQCRVAHEDKHGNNQSAMTLAKSFSAKPWPGHFIFQAAANNGARASRIGKCTTAAHTPSAMLSHHTMSYVP